MTEPLDYGPVLITGGKYRGRYGVYDDDECTCACSGEDGCACTEDDFEELAIVYLAGQEIYHGSGGAYVLVSPENLEAVDEDRYLEISTLSGYDVYDAKDADGCAYFVYSADQRAVKIGYSNNWDALISRFTTHQTSNASHLELALVLPGGKRTEIHLHTLFDECRLRGEWFTPNEKMLTFVAAHRGLSTYFANHPDRLRMAYRLIPKQGLAMIRSLHKSGYIETLLDEELRSWALTVIKHHAKET